MSLRIVNIMLGKKLGGIEQAFVNYGKVFEYLGYDCLNICHSKAQIKQQLKQENLSYKTLNNYGTWDIFSLLSLSKIIKSYNPDIVITHGNRASNMVLKNGFGNHITLAHNIRLKNAAKHKHIVAVSNEIKDFYSARSIADDKISVIPNLIDLAKVKLQQNPANQTLKIAAIGRLCEAKGFDILLKALKILDTRNIKFSAVIAGSGELEEELKSLASQLGLNKKLSFCGWVEDKNKFYNQADIICIPSRHEPFGIVILEAFAYKKPLVTTSTYGSRHICKDNVDSLVCTNTNNEEEIASSLADNIEKLVNSVDLRKNLAKSAYNKLEKQFTLPQVSKNIEKLIKNVI